MKDTLLEFTLNGKPHTFFRRIDFYGEPIITRIKENARRLDAKTIPQVIKKLILKYGKDSIKDFKMKKG